MDEIRLNFEGFMDGASTAPLSGVTGREHLFGLHPLVVFLLFQLLLWTLGPTLLFGNLHADTLEAAYWGRDWQLGYFKHPPLLSWTLDLALRTGLQPILALMLLSQLTVLVTAWFVWRIARLYASRETAALAVVLCVISPSATVYGVQLNHNSMLAPFWAATAWFGLSWLEERRMVDAVLLGIVAGLGMITKYEILFVLATLMVAGIAIPRFRPAFTHPGSYVAGALFVAIVTPHIWWLASHDWPSFSRAMGADKMSSLSDLNVSGVNLIVGLFTIFIVPAIVLVATARRRERDELTAGPAYRLIALILLLVPIFVLVLGAMVTQQVLKPLWLLPLASTTAIGLAILWPAGNAGFGLRMKDSARIGMIGSSSIFGAFALYLLIAGLIGKPLAAYSVDTRYLAQQTQALWDAQSKQPLACVVIADRKIGPSGVLWFESRPDFVDFSSPGWHQSEQIAQCRKSGGIAVLSEGREGIESFPRACLDQAQRINVPASGGMGRATFPVELIYIPAEEAGICPPR